MNLHIFLIILYSKSIAGNIHGEEISHCKHFANETKFFFLRFVSFKYQLHPNTLLYLAVSTQMDRVLITVIID
jgi:hypothetical protein